jgi:hypothetical protein
MLALTCLHHIMIPNGTIASSSIPICCFVLLHYILFFDVIRSTLWSRFVCQSCNHRHFYLVEDYNSTLWWRLGIEDSNSTLPSLRSLTHGPSFSTVSHHYCLPHGGQVVAQPPPFFFFFSIFFFKFLILFLKKFKWFLNDFFFIYILQHVSILRGWHMAGRLVFWQKT